MIEVTEKLIIKNISFFHVVTHRTSVRYSKHVVVLPVHQLLELTCSLRAIIM